MSIELYLNDCLAVFPRVKSASVDLICADPPYGITANKWDSVIPMEAMWAQLRRIVKPTGAIVMTATQPFATDLINGARELFKYEWIWEKNNHSGFIHAKNKPMRKHENVLVFAKGIANHESIDAIRMSYFPQGLREHEVTVKHAGMASRKNLNNWDRLPSHKMEVEAKYVGYPTTMLRFSKETKIEHPTQKPVDLFAYLIRSYTKPGDTVMDFCMGSGTTAVAAIRTGRKFLGVEQDPAYFAIAERRAHEAAAGGFFGRVSVTSGLAPVSAARVQRRGGSDR